MKESEIRNDAVFNEYLRLVAEEADSYFKDKERFRLVPCVACGCKDFHPQFKKQGFSYVLCDNCQTLYVNPRPFANDLLRFNNQSKSAAFWVNNFFLPMLESRRQNIFKPRARLLTQKLGEANSATVGDIGAGYGIFLEEFKRINPGAKATAVEPNKEMAQICRDKGFEVIDSAIEDVEGLDDKFDFLCAFELLEHLYEPTVLFRKAYSMLRAGGIFLLTTLNCQGFDIQVLWERSKNIYPPQHINFFNPHSLQEALGQCGFYCEEITTPGKLDWDIVEKAINDSVIGEARFWPIFAKSVSLDGKEDFQLFLSRHGLSSHMMALARK